MSHPGHPWENSPMERWWNDFKLIWLAKRARPETLEELEESVKESIEYFNTQRAYASKKRLDRREIPRSNRINYFSI